MTGLWLIVLLRCGLLLLSGWHAGRALSRSRCPHIKSYEQLVECYSDSLVPAKLHFFSFGAGLFEPYLTRFQTDVPMVLFMFDELSAIFKKLVGLIFKKDAIDNEQSIASMVNEKCLQD